ncbi:MAG: hypothetical protein FWG14_03620 [Peptococcaceae bacterium]|nr:hypothetical protein [Peptococcaceae bacterium]
MSDIPGLEEWNDQALMLVQALVGEISINFRMVVLLWDEEWVLKFYLEKNIEEDLEAVEAVVCQYTAYQTSGLKCRDEIVVGNGKLPSFSEGRAVYLCREKRT